MGIEDQKLFGIIVFAFIGIHIFGYSTLAFFCPSSGDLPFYCQPEEIKLKPFQSSGTQSFIVTSSMISLSTVDTSTTTI